MGWKPEDYIVAMLAGFITLFMMSVLVGIVIEHVPQSDQRTEAIAQVLTTVLTIISIYVGGKINHSMHDKNKDD